MDAIRRHSSAIERLERDIAIVKEALAAVATEDAPEGSAPEPEPAPAHPASSSVTRPPTPPPLRPAIGGPRLVAP